LRCLVVKGDLDLERDTDLARRDWSEARSVAEKPRGESVGEPGGRRAVNRLVSFRRLHGRRSGYGQRRKESARTG
jgi:hypothetical protein